MSETCFAFRGVRAEAVAAAQHCQAVSALERDSGQLTADLGISVKAGQLATPSQSQNPDDGGPGGPSLVGKRAHPGRLAVTFRRGLWRAGPFVNCAEIPNLLPGPHPPSSMAF